jgi:hypothetical protein
MEDDAIAIDPPNGLDEGVTQILINEFKEMTEF